MFTQPYSIDLFTNYLTVVSDDVKELRRPYTACKRRSITNIRQGIFSKVDTDYDDENLVGVKVQSWYYVNLRSIIFA